MAAIKTKSGMGRRRRNDVIFYAAFAALPILQYLIFYVAVNLNSVLLAFQKYEQVGDVYSYSFYGFGNFKQVFKELFTTPAMLITLKNSLIAYLSSLLIVTPLALFFSYYIMKKFAGSKIFRIILFVPTIVCSVISLFIFKTVMDEIFPEILAKILNRPKNDFRFLTNINTRFGTILFYSVFIGFGTNVLLYTGAMSGVDESLVESARLDGVTDFGEFKHIIFPCVFPTLVTFITVGVAGFFTNQLALFDLYGAQADNQIWTLGYYMYSKTIAGDERFSLYPYLSAMGIVFTLVATPVCIGVKALLEKIGPREA